MWRLMLEVRVCALGGNQRAVGAAVRSVAGVDVGAVEHVSHRFLRPTGPLSSPGQLELLKLSFFPAIFASAPSVGVLANAESDSLAGSCGSGWALEYAGAVRNMLYAL
jgi:hypothetical protein